jgi:hypothetical protein
MRVISAAARTAARLSMARSSCAAMSPGCCVAVGVHSVLSAADEQPLVALDQLGLVESQLDRPRPGVDRRSFHVSVSLLGGCHFGTWARSVRDAVAQGSCCGPTPVSM